MQVTRFSEKSRRGWKAGYCNSWHQDKYSDCIGVVSIGELGFVGKSQLNFISFSTLITPHHAISTISKEALEQITKEKWDLRSTSSSSFQPNSLVFSISDTICSSVTTLNILPLTSLKATEFKQSHLLVLFTLEIPLGKQAGHFGIVSYDTPLELDQISDSFFLPSAEDLSTEIVIDEIICEENILISADSAYADQAHPLCIVDKTIGCVLVAIVINALPSTNQLDCLILSPRILKFLEKSIDHTPENQAAATVQVLHLSDQAAGVMRIPPNYGSSNPRLARIVSSLQQSHQDGIYMMCRVNDNIIASSSVDKSVRTWEVIQTESQPKSLHPLTKLDCEGCCRDFSCEGELLVGTSENFVIMMNWKAGQIETAIPCSNKLYSVLWQPRTNRILAGDCYGNINIIVKSSFIYSIRSFDSQTSPHGHQGSVNVLHALSQSNSDTILSAGEFGEIKAWQISSNFSLLNSFVGHDPAKSVYFLEIVNLSKSAITLVSGGSDKTVRLWDFDSAQNIKTFDLMSPVYAACLVSPFELIVGNAEDITIIDLTKLSLAEGVSGGQSERKHAARINAICKISSNSFASADTQGNMIVWELYERPTPAEQDISEQVKAVIKEKPRKGKQLLPALEITTSTSDSNYTQLRNLTASNLPFNDKSPLAYKKDSTQSDFTVAKTHTGLWTSLPRSPKSSSTSGQGNSTTSKRSNQNSIREHNNAFSIKVPTLDDNNLQISESTMIRPHNNNSNHSHSNISNSSINSSAIQQSRDWLANRSTILQQNASASYVELLKSFDDNDKYSMIHQKKKGVQLDSDNDQQKSLRSTPTDPGKVMQQQQGNQQFSAENHNNSSKYQRQSDLKDLHQHYNIMIDRLLRPSEQQSNSIIPLPKEKINETPNGSIKKSQHLFGLPQQQVNKIDSHQEKVQNRLLFPLEQLASMGGAIPSPKRGSQMVEKIVGKKEIRTKNEHISNYQNCKCGWQEENNEYNVQLKEENRRLREENISQSTQLDKYSDQIKTLLSTIQKSEDERISMVEQFQELAPQIQTFSQMITAFQLKDQEKTKIIKHQEVVILELQAENNELSERLTFRPKDEQIQSKIKLTGFSPLSNKSQTNSQSPKYVNDKINEDLVKYNRTTLLRGDEDREQKRNASSSSLHKHSSSSINKYDKNQVISDLRILQQEALSLQKDIILLKEATVGCESDESMRQLLSRLQRMNVQYQRKSDQIIEMKTLYQIN